MLFFRHIRPNFRIKVIVELYIFINQRDEVNFRVHGRISTFVFDNEISKDSIIHKKLDLNHKKDLENQQNETKRILELVQLITIFYH